MKLTVDVVTLSQELDLSTGHVTNVLTLLLPGGAKVNAPVPPEVAQGIIESALADVAGTPPEPAQDYAGSGDEVYEFPSVQQKPQPTRVRRPQVTTDAYGYPVVHGAPKPAPVADGDEDGIGQL